MKRLTMIHDSRGYVDALIDTGSIIGVIYQDQYLTEIVLAGGAKVEIKNDMDSVLFECGRNQ